MNEYVKRQHRNNRVLYSDEIYYLDFIEDNLGLELHNITALDLCLDLSMSFLSVHSKSVLAFASSFFNSNPNLLGLITSFCL